MENGLIELHWRSTELEDNYGGIGEVSMNSQQVCVVRNDLAGDEMEIIVCVKVIVMKFRHHQISK